MKLRSRDINVFSISALDLFASALGGFMLLTIIFMPFFPNTGDSAVRVADVQADLDQTRAEAEVTREALAAAEQEAEELQRRVAELEKILTDPQVEFPPLDIVIALDTTGSMGTQIEGLKAEITQFLELLDVLSPSVAMGLIDFKDRCMGADQIRTFPLRFVDASTIIAVRSFTFAMNTNNPCNPDAEEAVGAALDAAVRMGWRSEADLHLIVIITDNLPYPDESDRVLDVASRFSAQGEGYQVAAAYVDTGAGLVPRLYLGELATRGGGAYVQAGQSMAVTLLKAMAGS